MQQLKSALCAGTVIFAELIVYKSWYNFASVEILDFPRVISEHYYSTKFGDQGKGHILSVFAPEVFRYCYASHKTKQYFHKVNYGILFYIITNQVLQVFTHYLSSQSYIILNLLWKQKKLNILSFITKIVFSFFM